MRKTLRAKLLLAAIGVLVLEGILFQTLAASLLGLGLLFLVLYRRWVLLASLKGARFHVTRTVLEPITHVETPFNVNVELIAHAPGFHVKATEDVPAGLQEHTGTFTAEGDGSGPLRMRYALLALERDTFRWGGLHLHLTDPWGLFEETRFVPAPTEVRIHASASALQRGQLLSRKSPMEATKRALQAHFSRSEETEGIRPYQPGDRLRDIDWKATSRLQALTSRTHLSERESSLVILIDASRTMRQRHHEGATKLDHAATLAVELVEAAARRNRPAGAFVYDEGHIIAELPIEGGKDQGERLLRLLRALPPNLPTRRRLAVGNPTGALLPAERDVVTRLRSLHPVGARFAHLPGVRQTVGHLSGKYKQGGILAVTFSDFETNPHDVVNALSILTNANHTVIAAIMPGTKYRGSQRRLSFREVEAAYLERANRRWVASALASRHILALEMAPGMGAEAIATPRRTTPTTPGGRA